MRLLYLHLPRFPVQRRVLETPSLQGKPFVLLQEKRGTRMVSFASTSALKVGIRPGMTFAAASALEPGLPTYLYDPVEEERALGSLGEALLAFGTAFELSAPDGLFLDASASHLFGTEASFGARVLERCQQLGFRGKVAVAGEKFTVRALSRYGEKRVTVIPPGAGGSAAHALAPLPLHALEGTLEAVRTPLGELGLKTLGELTALPPASVVARLGALGLRAQRLSQGRDDARLVPAALEEKIEERFVIEWGAQTLEPVLFALKSVLDRVAARLQGRQRAAVRLALVMHLADGSDAIVGMTLARPSSQAKLLLELGRHHLSELKLEHPVQGVSVRVEETSEDRGQQLVLGEAPQGDAALEVVLSRLTTALGEGVLFATEVHDSHRPEQGYRAGRFSPPARAPGLLGEAQIWGGKEGAGEEGSAGALEFARDARLERPARLLPQATHLDVDLGTGGQLLAARVLGKRRKVTAIAGPERLLGEWWATPFSRDYYRVHFDGVGPVWLYRDGQDGRFYLQGLFD